MEAKIGLVEFHLTWTGGDIVELPPPQRARALKFIDSFRALGNGEPEPTKRRGRPAGSRNRTVTPGAPAEEDGS